MRDFSLHILLIINHRYFIGPCISSLICLDCSFSCFSIFHLLISLHKNGCTIQYSLLLSPADDRSPSSFSHCYLQACKSLQKSLVLVCLAFTSTVCLSKCLVTSLSSVVESISKLVVVLARIAGAFLNAYFSNSKYNLEQQI